MTRHSGAGVVSAIAGALLLGACAREAPSREVDTAASAASAADVRPTPPAPARYGIGRAASATDIRAWDIDIGPDGRELPRGRGSYADGARLYAAKCAMCHGQKGEGMGQGHAAYPRLIGREPREGFPFGRDPSQVKTIGNYWPYATTLFDYVRRAMPLTAPGSLTDDETYALVAYLLAENEVVKRDAVMDAATLRRVVMPARGRFVRDDRKGGAEVR